LTTRILDRCEEARVRALTPRRPDERCGIVALECDRPEDVEAALLGQKIVVDSRPGRIRLSPHWCLTEEEVDQATDRVLTEIKKGR
jgi:kynureninase